MAEIAPSTFQRHGAIVKTPTQTQSTIRARRSLRVAACVLAAASTVALALMASESAHADEVVKISSKRFGAGIDINTTPRVEDSGLPLYPGATIDKRRHRDDDIDSSDGVNLNLWFGSYGVKVVAIKLKSTDNPDQVQAFYQRALASYGDVLDCSAESDAGSRAERRAKARAEKKSNVLTCDDSSLKKSSEREGKFFKAGTKARQYAVSVKGDGAGSAIQLLHVEKRSGDE